MSPAIRIPEKTFARLQYLAVPFTDTPASVIERLLDFHDEHTEAEDGTSLTRRSTVGLPRDRKIGRAVEPTRNVGGKGEVVTFAQRLRARDLKSSHDPRFNGFLKRRNYFVLGEDTYLIIKVSRTSKPFFGLGKQFIELFNDLTENSGTYYFVGLDSATSGWLVSKSRLLQEIENGSISASGGSTTEYKINDYNLRTQERFLSVDDCRSKLSM